MDAANINSRLGRKIRSRVDRMLREGHLLLNMKSDPFDDAPCPTSPHSSPYSAGCLVGLLTVACSEVRHFDTISVAADLKVSTDVVRELEAGFEGWDSEDKDPQIYGLGRALALHYGLL